VATAAEVSIAQSISEPLVRLVSPLRITEVRTREGHPIHQVVLHDMRDVLRNLENLSTTSWEQVADDTIQEGQDTDKLHSTSESIASLPLRRTDDRLSEEEMQIRVKALSPLVARRNRLLLALIDNHPKDAQRQDFDVFHEHAKSIDFPDAKTYVALYRGSVVHAFRCARAIHEWASAEKGRESRNFSKKADANARERVTAGESFGRTRSFTQD
jgi:hypothetical protein